MPRIPRERATKGSQKWLQELVNRYPDILEAALRPQLEMRADDTIMWLSPLEDDAFAEYQDDSFLGRAFVCLEDRSLDSFWPEGGPVWDGLGRTKRGDILLLEAKSHIPELSSSCRAGAESLSLIRNSLAETARFFGASSSANWPDGHYQYANRLAHQYLLRHLNRLPAWLVFVYFTGDSEAEEPESVEDWRSAIDGVHTHLGMTPEKLRPYVVDLFIDVADLGRCGEHAGR